MKRLFVIEGFDRAGKDTLINDLLKVDLPNDTYVYVSDLEGLPKYDKEQESFIKWLNKLIEKQTNEISELFKKYDNVIMCRLLISDEVYSDLFNREHTTIKYMEKLKNVKLKNYCLLFINYDQYIERIKMLNSEIQYNELDFDKINELYEIKVKEYGGMVKYLKAKTTQESVLNDFLLFMKLNDK